MAKKSNHVQDSGYSSLVEELFHTFSESGEEWMLLTVNVSAEEVKCVGSAAGRAFGIDESDLTRKFLQYCQTYQFMKAAEVEGADCKEEEIKFQHRKRGKVVPDHKEVIKSEVPAKIINDDNGEDEDKEYGLYLDESDDWIPDGERRETEKKKVFTKKGVISRNLQSVGSQTLYDIVATRRSLRLRTQVNARNVEVKTKEKGKEKTKIEINSKPVKLNLKLEERNLEKVTNHKMEKNDENETSDKNSESGEEKHCQLQKQKRQATYTCSVCTTVLKTRFSLKQHMIRHDLAKKNSFRCSTCGRGFCRKQDMKKHSKMHSNIKPYECTLCNKKFKTLSHKRTHDIIHHSDKELSKIEGDKFLCKFCGGIYNSLYSLAKHLPKHMNKIQLSGNMEELAVAREDQPYYPRESQQVLPIAMEELAVAREDQPYYPREDQQVLPIAMEELAVAREDQSYYPREDQQVLPIAMEELAVACEDQPYYPREDQQVLPLAITNVGASAMTHEDVHEAKYQSANPVESENFLNDDEVVESVYKVSEDEIKVKKIENAEIYKSSSLDLQLNDKLDEASNELQKLIQESLQQASNKDDEITKLTCDKCGKKFKSKNDFNNHALIHNKKGPVYSCDLCGRLFRKPMALLEHRKFHDNSGTYTCKACGKKLKTINSLRSHAKIHQEVKDFICPECNKGFTEKWKLKQHMLSHTKEKAFICDQCGKAFRGAKDLRSHLLTHSEERPFECKICKMTFIFRGRLKGHMAVHSDFKKYMCHTCGRRFKQKHSLLTHQRSHSSEPTTYCEECGRGFKSSQGLQSHYVSFHMKPEDYKSGKIKYFTCNFCGKAFKGRQDRDNHLRVHTKEKLACVICGKQFSNRKTLRTHFRNHDYEKPYKCSVCAKGFLFTGDLKKHMAVHDQKREKDATKTTKQNYSSTYNDNSNSTCSYETPVVVNQQALAIDHDYTRKQHLKESNTAACSVIVEDVPAPFFGAN